MKKVKSMFGAIALIAVLGAALAFKAKHNYLSNRLIDLRAIYRNHLLSQVGLPCCIFLKVAR